MKESTRYALLLFAVLTFITSSYIAINTLGESTEPKPSDTENEINNTVQEINETNNTEENSEKASNRTDNNEEPEGIIEKSLHGLSLLFSDIGEGMKILSN